MKLDNLSIQKVTSRLNVGWDDFIASTEAELAKCQDEERRENLALALGGFRFMRDVGAEMPGSYRAGKD